MLRTAFLTAVLVAAPSGVALAQGAPGACVDCFAPAPPPTAAPAPELSRRIGIGLRASSLAIANEADPDQPTQLLGGGLHIRYRVTPRWELQLALDGLREHDADGTPVGPELHAATIGAMFHLRPLAAWDIYLVAAAGGIAPHAEEPSREPAAEPRVQAHLGIGLEHRWNRLGLSAELRAVAIAPAERMSSTTTRPGSIPTAEIEAKPDQGALATLAVTYFF